MSNTKKILIILGIILIFAIGIPYDAFYNAPKRYTVRYETLSDTSIPEQLDDINILYFTDLHYGKFMDNTRLTSLVNRINDLGPDVVLFGGDLTERKLNREEKLKVIDLLSQIDAPLGKFAVLGDSDYRSTAETKLSIEILEASGFELLYNESILLRNKRSKGITLVGIDSASGGNPDVTAAFQNVAPNSYTIVMCHTPDTALTIPSHKTNYYLAGHSHGGQVYYIYDSLFKPDYCEYFFMGKDNYQDTFTVDVSSGVGTTQQDVRFLANAEVVIYRLKHLSTQE
ncbi:MAG: metallophosphoesterase [Erysipelotrichaceae bacterium]|nr:metallophosphoesterase [Erysipelotrichaceae bacterium]